MTIEQLEIKLKDYKGNVAHSWKTPKTKRQAAFAVQKLYKLYARCQKSNLLTTEMVNAIKGYAKALYDLGETKVYFVARPELVGILHKLMNIETEGLTEEIITEKRREHENAVCSFCTTKLKYPAYVVFRKGLEIVKESDPVGIFCLKGLYGKLEDLTKEVLVSISYKEDECSKDENNKVVESTIIHDEDTTFE